MTNCAPCRTIAVGGFLHDTILALAVLTQQRYLSATQEDLGSADEGESQVRCSRRLKEPSVAQALFQSRCKIQQPQANLSHGVRKGFDSTCDLLPVNNPCCQVQAVSRNRASPKEPQVVSKSYQTWSNVGSKSAGQRQLRKTSLFITLSGG